MYKVSRKQYFFGNYTNSQNIQYCSEEMRIGFVNESTDPLQWVIQLLHPWGVVAYVARPDSSQPGIIHPAALT